MAKLTTKERKKIPAKEFGEPGKRAYPMPDKSHAANAKARASQAVKAGRMSKSEEGKIDRKADRVLGHGKSRESHERSEHRAETRHGRNEAMLKTKSAHERHREAKEHHAPKAHKLHEAKHHPRPEHRSEMKREHEGKRHESKREEHKEDRKEEHKKAHHRAVERKDEHKERGHRKEHEGHKHVHVHHHIHRD